MGLITKKVKIKWNISNKSFYQDKGYTFTKMKDEFEVKVEDLSNGSDVTVFVKCDGDNCNKIYSLEWRSYLDFSVNDKIYCLICSKHKDKGFISFEQWCIEHNRLDILTR